MLTNSKTMVWLYLVLLSLVCGNNMIVIPSNEEQKGLVDCFSNDMKLYTHVDSVTKQIMPVMCCICDGIPTCPNWHDFVSINHFVKLCSASALHKAHVKDFYSANVLSCYTVNDE